MYTKAHFDWNALPPLTSPRRLLELKGVALGLINLPPQAGYTFTHRHREQEEVYIVLEGSGRLLVVGELVPLAAGDVVRDDPASSRALKNDGDTPLRVVCAGAVPAGYPRHENSRYLIDDGVPDYDDIPPWYAGDERVATQNATLKDRYLRALARRRQEGADGEE
jgi:mannose-6-phosphate isomerase-like protein (cupin superfamily)